MRYEEFVKSNLIVSDTLNLFESDLKKLLSSSSFKESRTKNLALGNPVDWFCLNDLSNSLKGVGINSIEVLFDFDSYHVESINIYASMGYVGYINFILERYSDNLLGNIDSIHINPEIFSNSLKCVVYINSSSRLADRVKLNLPSYDNSVLKFVYAMDLTKYRNKFRLEESSYSFLSSSLYMNLLDRNIKFYTKDLANEPLYVKFTLYEEDDCESFFNLLSRESDLRLGYKNLVYHITVNHAVLKDFKSYSLSHLNSLSDKVDSHLKLNFTYHVTDVDEEFLKMLDNFNKHYIYSHKDER